MPDNSELGGLNVLTFTARLCAATLGRVVARLTQAYALQAYLLIALVAVTSSSVSAQTMTVRDDSAYNYRDTWTDIELRVRFSITGMATYYEDVIAFGTYPNLPGIMLPAFTDCSCRPWGPYPYRAYAYFELLNEYVQYPVEGYPYMYWQDDVQWVITTGGGPWEQACSGGVCRMCENPKEVTGLAEYYDTVYAGFYVAAY
jgi:hypothetical protein